MNGIDKCEIKNHLDENQNPTGGSVKGVGLDIEWQNGPLGRGEDRIEPNGAFVETVISSAKSRLHFYQQGKYNCRENELAIKHLNSALQILNSRTSDREAREVEGMHKV